MDGEHVCTAKSTLVERGKPAGHHDRHYASVEPGTELPAKRSTGRPRLDLVKYAGASGDFNVIHWNERIARARRPAERDRARHVHDGAGRQVRHRVGGRPGSGHRASACASPPWSRSPTTTQGATIEVSGTVARQARGQQGDGRHRDRAGRRHEGADPRPRRRPPSVTDLGGATFADYTTLGLGGPAKNFVAASTDADLDRRGPGRRRGRRASAAPRRRHQPGDRRRRLSAAPSSTSAPVASATPPPNGRRRRDRRRRRGLGRRGGRHGRRGTRGPRVPVRHPGPAGATPIQNVGAYGHEVAEVITTVRVFDRQDRPDPDSSRTRVRLLLPHQPLQERGAPGLVVPPGPVSSKAAAARALRGARRDVPAGQAARAPCR